VPVLVGILMGDVAKATIKDSNPALFIALGIFAVAFVVLFLMQIPEPHLTTVAKSTVKDKHSALSFRHFILGAIAIFVYVGVEVGIPNITNLFMTSGIDKGGLGIDTGVAGAVVGTYWFLMLIGRLAGASFATKFSSKAMLIFVSLLGLVFVTLAIFSPLDSLVSMPVFQKNISFGLAQVPISIMFLILCGLCTSVMWGGIFNLAVEGLGKYTAAASGFFMVLVCGGGLLPLVQGYVADTFSYIASYWVIFFGLAYMLYYGVIGSKNVNKDIPVE
jgi:FHS family L-fucose permease-like MFS transporter